MDGIRDYFASAAFAICAAGIVGLFPLHEKMSKYVRYTVSLAVLAVMLLPLRPAFDLLRSISLDDGSFEAVIDGELEKYYQQTNDILLEKNTDILKDALKQRLRTDLSIPEHECDVFIVMKAEAGEARMDSVTVTLYGYSVWKDPHEIKAYVEDLCKCGCEVVIG